MVQFDNQYRKIKIKIVYYGPALGGKTTCLQHIHRVTDPQRRTKLYSLNTASDRTLFFDLLSLNLGRIRGYRLAMQLYTVPGQVQYNATRRAVLSGADGVVFVADSQTDQRAANRQSLENLWENLAANGLFDPSSQPTYQSGCEPALTTAGSYGPYSQIGLICANPPRNARTANTSMKKPVVLAPNTGKTRSPTTLLSVRPGPGNWVCFCTHRIAMWAAIRARMIPGTSSTWAM